MTTLSVDSSMALGDAGHGDAQRLQLLQAELDALHRSQAVIEFEVDGTVRTANENFLQALGYRLEEIVGKHHSMFVPPQQRNTDAYRKFWADLKGGVFQSGEFQRVGKGGKDVWIHASYNPIRDSNGRPFKVVKFASDITEAKLRSADSQGQLEAIGKSMAVIEFALDGKIRHANENFLKTLGYRIDEVVGKHHSMFVDPAERSSEAYRQFWSDLGSGKFQAGEFKRIGNGGKVIWIQASYNPIFDPSGRPFKVVKFASDVTDQVNARRKNAQIVESVRAAAIRLSASSSDLSTVTKQIAVDADDSSGQVRSVAAAAEQVSRNNQSVATSIDEMGASIKSISASTTQAAKVATQAVELSSKTNETVTKLGHSSTEIGRVIKTITAIAQQTNLLALNATIESARAGELGKGFAVVANEVKQLAKLSAQASEDIARRIESIQGDTTSAIAAIAEISRVIDDINMIQTTVASAVEEQTAVTAEIGRNIAESVRGGEEIARSITSVAKSAESTAHGVQSAQRSVGDLAKMASELDLLVKV